MAYDELVAEVLKENESLRAENARLLTDNNTYLRVFGHYFVPDNESDQSETCLKCKLNLRNPIHYRADDPRQALKEASHDS